SRYASLGSHAARIAATLRQCIRADSPDLEVGVPCEKTADATGLRGKQRALPVGQAKQRLDGDRDPTVPRAPIPYPGDDPVDEQQRNARGTLPPATFEGPDPRAYGIGHD